MRVGISLTSSISQPGPVAAAWMIERARLANEVGLDHLSLGDRHNAGPGGQYIQGAPMLGRLLAEWDPSRPAGLLFLLPLWSPVLVAEQVGTLSTLLDAPVIVQTGIGSGAAQFGAFGVDHRRRGRLTDEAIGVVDGLLRGETVDSEMLGVTEASVRPVPTHGVEWWVGGGLGAVPIERAARRGDAWYVSPGVRGDDLRDGIERYRQACAGHGRPPRVALRRDVVGDTDHAAARRRADEIAAAGYRGMPADALLAGDADSLADELQRLAEVGVDDVVIRCADPDQAAALRTIETFGEARRSVPS